MPVCVPVPVLYLYMQNTAPSPPSHLTKSDVFVDENYSDVNITLKELVDKYYEQLPVLIRVTQGVCGRDERVTLFSLDCFKVHFLKHVDVINITSSCGDRYSVPQSSMLEFGLVYKNSLSLHRKQWNGIDPSRDLRNITPSLNQTLKSPVGRWTVKVTN